MAMNIHLYLLEAYNHGVKASWRNFVDSRKNKNFPVIVSFQRKNNVKNVSLLENKD